MLRHGVRAGSDRARDPARLRSLRRHAAPHDSPSHDTTPPPPRQGRMGATGPPAAGESAVNAPRHRLSDGALRVIVADDDSFARRRIRSVLEDAGMIGIAEAKHGREAIERGLHQRPDVIVMDAVMPGLDGVHATRKIVKALPDQLVVMLTSACEDELGLLALRAGAVGFLSKDFDIDSLPRALEGVRAGEAAVSREMTARLIEQLRSAPNGNSGLRPV